MARTEQGAALTQRHRRHQIAIRAAALRDLATLWLAVDPLNLAGTIGLFAAASAVVIRARNRDSAAVAGRYFQDFRAAEGITGALAVLLGEPPPDELVTGLIRGAGLSGIIRARQRGLSAQAAAQNGFVQVAGTASNLVLDGGREVITQATVSDPRSTGKYQRVASSGACAWCAMQASRGPVFDTRAFKRHDGCNCDAEPVYKGSRLPATSERFREQWERTTGGLSGKDALNAFRRAREDRPAPTDPIAQAS